MNAEPHSRSHVGEDEERLTVTELRSPGVAVHLAVSGELDVETTAMFQRWLSDILDGRPGRPLELDLSTLDFCDLSGLRALAGLGAAQQRSVRITTAGPCLDVLLDLCETPIFLGYVPPSSRFDGTR